MGVFRNRPLALAIGVFMIAALMGVKMESEIKLWLGIGFMVVATVLCLVSWLRKKCGKRFSVLILCFLGAAVALFQSWLFFNVATERFRERDGEQITAEGYVCERLESGSYESRLAVRLWESDGERVSAKVLLECEYPSALQAGDTFRLTGTVRLPINTELYPEETVLISDGYVGILTCAEHQDCTILEDRRITPRIWLLSVRNVLSDRLSDAIGDESGALASALLLGDRGKISGDTELAFQRSGISHLLALSGLHISILIGFLEILLRKFGIAKQFRAFFVPAAAVFYLLLTGCALSTVRAVLMLCILYLAYLFREDYDPFTALCTALLLILLFAPYAVSDVSMWMSFAASAGIVVFISTVTKLFSNVPCVSLFSKWGIRFLKGILTALAVGLFANAAILPLLAYFFGSTSMFSVGLTLLLSPVLTPALALSALSLLLPWCIPITYLSRMLLKLILFLAYRTSEIPNAMVLLNGTVTMILVNLLVLLTVLLAVVELKRKKWMLLPLLLSVAVLLVAYADVMPRGTGTSVTYLRSQSDEALVIAKERTAVAIDFSEGTSAIGKRIVSAVTEAKCTELGELILTHYHSDASHLIASLTSQIKLRTLRLPIPNCEKETAIAARLEQEAELHGVAVRYGTDELALEGLEVRMLQRTADENRIEVPTLVSLLINEHSLVYLGGNIWSSEWFSYAESASISSEILILGAHGTTSLPNEKIFGKLTNTKRIIFGSRELFFQCPYDALPHEYAAEVEFKRFFLK